jgi:hypothetical protein
MAIGAHPDDRQEGARAPRTSRARLPGWAEFVGVELRGVSGTYLCALNLGLCMTRPFGLWLSVSCGGAICFIRLDDSQVMWGGFWRLWC